jgi:hypothetical protein
LFEAGKRLQHQDPAGTYAHQIFNRLLIDLSYNSSRLEGNTYSLLDTQRLLLKGKSAEGKLNEEKVMILNHKEAIRYLVDNAGKIKINAETIFTIHYLLSEGLVDSQDAGKVRDYEVRIGGSTYLPIGNQEKIKNILQVILQKAADIKDPYEQSIFLLIHLSYLQVFADVNKRTARLSANISLIKNNLVPLSFNDVNREDYTSSIIAIYELQNTQPLVDLYCFSYLRTCAAYDATVKNIGFDEMRVRYRSERRLLLRAIILQQLSGVALQQYVDTETAKLIPNKDSADFIEDLMEDIKEMDIGRIAGLGITAEALARWLKSRE